MPDQVITHALADALPSLGSPDGVHRLAMSPLPDLAGASRAIRADLGILYRVSLPTEHGGQSGKVAIRYRAPLTITGAVAVEGPEDLAVGQRFTVRLVAEKRHEDSGGRTHARPVRDEEAESWCQALLHRHGIKADDLVVSPRWKVGRPGARSFTVRDLTATVTGLTADCTAFTRGLGRGKSFGYGMPLVL
ncbi:type I-E CRISPR-associated protein Cas6/Cse3/CasE [Actinomyces sp. 2119]|uniref:Type I-E CRISPR-associated protein Cas6/Cse3/CasE n=1 Tax=Actinomyces lilanjuaniae TaxID=2321394 RepID=A0ABM6Z148_9ACTO|nr:MULTISPECIES: type I-E CRISPR-associated protein Cas6/Cse3/CasE [Actinomyces]AYD88985.1 type I-E CRISPR-associated protein Cas6/Cse3/CasE [Actinomyces lilanjuaniae]RJF41161.1 type I-E CRISPR-associated protein Cas6/Cse3/CasE [Actinomyces sp. 2119]